MKKPRQGRHIPWPGAEDVAPDGAWICSDTDFYKYIAPTALKKSIKPSRHLEKPVEARMRIGRAGIGERKRPVAGSDDVCVGRPDYWRRNVGCPFQLEPGIHRRIPLKPRAAAGHNSAGNGKRTPRHRRVIKKHVEVVIDVETVQVLNTEIIKSAGTRK